MASNKQVASLVEIGSSGVQIFNGIISGEEYNANLRGRNALKTWDEMRRSDATVKMTLKALKEPIKALNFFITPASDSPKDIEIAEFANRVIFDVLRWKTTLSEILTHLEFGFAVFEKVYEYRVLDGVERIVLKKLAFRKQRSIAKWIAGDEPGVTQYGSAGKMIPIPLDRIVVFTNEQEGDNYEGMSILRAAYKHWYYKDKLYQIDAIGQERHALGVVKIKHPKNATSTQIESGHAAARALRANEEAFIDEPEGWDINFMDMKAGTLKDTKPSIEHHDREIYVNGVSQFMNLGSTSGSGSRAVGEPQMKVYEQAVQSVAELISDTFTLYVLKDLIDMNFNVTDYPKMSTGKVSADNIPALAEAFERFVKTGAIEPTEEDEAHIRNLIDFPERTDESTIKPVKSKTKDAPAAEDDDGEEVEIETKASVLNRAKSVLASLKEKLYGDKKRSS